MKIVYILEQFYLHGGIEKITSTKINWLINNNYDVTLIVSNQYNKPFVYRLNNKVTFIDLKINYIENVSYFKLKNLIKSPNHFIKLNKTLKNIKPDFVITLSLQFDYYFLPFITKAKTIREFHSSRYLYDINRNKKKSFYKKIKYIIHDYIEKKYTHNVVLTPDEKKHYKSNNVIIIPNGISLSKNKTSNNLTNKRVITAGRLAPVKNFESLLKIWKKVILKYPNWKLDIYGEGDIKYKNKLQNIILSLSIEKSCFICGSTKYLDKEMINSSIYAMTSITECYPMVLLEAQSVGLPIVSFDCPYGPKNIITNNEDGILVENQNDTKFANAIIKLIQNEEIRLKMGRKAKENVKKNQLDITMTKWLGLFNKNTIK